MLFFILKCFSCRVVVFSGFISVLVFKSCVIDIDLGMIVGVVICLICDGEVGVDLGWVGVCLNDVFGVWNVWLVFFFGLRNWMKNILWFLICLNLEYDGFLFDVRIL